ncbi:class I SAM-dependent methyltransferase [Oligoflexus tunisiensis]|uniref:class I SAM-dependent methyltransferase n=1 Tax=Oligoflexus tunisiensis TaxID=708132 RepID=UPI00114CDC2F|nr:SAM-dependent methyltransferase [Oligoflexus tunisiensis]
MKEQKSSDTAESAAATRALETLRAPDQRLIEDPYAFLFLGVLNKCLITLGRSQHIRSWTTSFYERKFPGVMGEFVFRTAAIDRILLQAAQKGGIQVVLCGAGYDSRSLRFPKDLPIRWFELDHPATQAKKQITLQKAGLQSPSTMIPLDFESDFLQQNDLLLRHGLDQSVPTFFLMEGVSYYLQEESFARFLTWIASQLIDHMEVIFNFLDKGFLENPASFPGGKRIDAHVKKVGEPFLFGLAPKEIDKWLGDVGFKLIKKQTVADYAAPLMKNKQKVYVYSSMFLLARAINKQGSES